LITGAADDDPSGIATYSQAGAQFGFSLLWTMALTYPLMTAVQLVSAEVGRVTGAGLSQNMMRVMPRFWVEALVVLLLIANTINIGADLAAMGQAAALVAGAGDHWFTLGFTVLTLTLQLFVPYHRYAGLLKWMTLALLAYVAILFVVRIDWGAVVHGLVWPFGATGAGVMTMIVALFGTTISPYLFFWQSAQEVEEIIDHPGETSLIEGPQAARAEFRRMRFDTIVGMALSNIVSMAIIIAAAATLHTAGKTDVATAADAARALEPLAGHFAFLLFSLGIIGTGLLAVPVLAGSAAYGMAEVRGWISGLEHPPPRAPGFYGVIVAATVCGLAIDWSPLDPIKALFWSAVVNGVVAAPILVGVLLAASSEKVMGRFRIRGPLLWLSWLTAVLMGGAALMIPFQ
jgi:Mn2+/Fe2+ NRAMP family transporter